MKSHSKAIRFILFRYLLSSWMSNVLPVIGVGIGVLFFTVVLSIMGGFVYNTKMRLLGLESHIEIILKDSFGMIPANDALLEKLSKISPDVVGVSPFQRADAILQSNSRPATIFLHGIDPDKARKTTEIENYLGNKELSVLKEPMLASGLIPESKFPPLVVGRELLTLLRIGVGDRVTLVSTSREQGPFGLAPSQLPAIVSDEIYVGKPDIDAKWVVGSIDFVNEFLGTEGMWAGIQMKVKDPLHVDDMVEKLDPLLAKDGLRAKPWTESNRALLRALQLERWGMSFVMFMIILVGCFGITIILVLSVRRKTREMAILRSMGLKKVDLGLIYLLYGFSIGSMGVILGLDGGLRLLTYLHSKPIPLLSVYGDKPYPVLVDWSQIGFAAGGSLLLAMVASIWPAVEVMRIDVAETLSDRG